MSQIIIKNEYDLTYHDEELIINLIEKCHGHYENAHPVIYGDILLLLLKSQEGQAQNYNNDEKLIGLAIIATHHDYFNIDYVSVHADYRRRGYAKEIIKGAIGYICELSAEMKEGRYIKLDVEPDNIIAINLYEKYGFVIDKKREKIYYMPDGTEMKTHPMRLNIQSIKV
jgi:ribosomal protein S18 acetylase RimI-like enzyme